MKRLLLIFVVLFFLAACLPVGSSRPASTPALGNSVATSAYANADRSIAEFQVTQDAVNSAATLTSRDRDATATAVAQRASTTTAVQQTLDANTIKESNARVTIAAAQVTQAAVDVAIAQTHLVSATNAMTTAIVLNTQAVSEQQARYNDPVWRLIQFLGGALVPCGGTALVLLLLYALLIWVRALAARLAGDKHRAEIAMRVHFPLLAAPLPREEEAGSEESGVASWETRDHGITPESREISEKNTGNTGSVFPVNAARGSRYLWQWTPDERRILFDFRVRVIEMLDRAIAFNRENGGDDRYIPRYNKIGMKTEHRQELTHALRAIGAVTIERGGDDQGTKVTDLYGTVENLRTALIEKRVTVFPEGFHSTAEQRAADLNEQFKRDLAEGIKAVPEAS